MKSSFSDGSASAFKVLFSVLQEFSYIEDPECGVEYENSALSVSCFVQMFSSPKVATEVVEKVIDKEGFLYFVILSVGKETQRSYGIKIVPSCPAEELKMEDLHELWKTFITFRAPRFDKALPLLC